MTSNNLNFLSLNIGMSNSLAGLTSLVASESLDLIFLQEVRLTSSELKVYFLVLVVLLTLILKILQSLEQQ